MNDLVERLRAVVNAGPDFLGNDEGRCVTCSYRNPDGPEAAALIRQLQRENADMREALRKLATLDLAAIDPKSGVSCDADEHDAAIAEALRLSKSNHRSENNGAR